MLSEAKHLRVNGSTSLTVWFDRLTTLSNVEGLSLSKDSARDLEILRAPRSE